MRSRFSKPVSLAGCRGQAMVYFPLFIVGLLIVGGLMVDTANSFLTKSRLRRALDATAMAGIVRYSHGFLDGDVIERDSEALIRYNLNEMGIEDSKIMEASAVFTIDENRVATLDLGGRVRFPTIFMRFIAGADLDFSTVAAAAVSRRYPAVISLVLDTSGSMAGTKITSLKRAAKAFVDSFQEGVDQMALIHFGDTARVLQPMALIDKPRLRGMIDGLTAGGWTNISEAVTLGRIQIENSDDPDAEFEPVKAILLFTDGAPNIFAGIFTNERVPPLVRNFPQQNPVDFNGYFNAGNQPTRIADRNTYQTRCSGSGGGGADVRSCFTDLRYLDSRLNVRPLSHLISRTSRSDQLKEAYNLAIVETDYAKADGTIVYTIGLGSQASEGSDPYQGATNFNPIKSYLLRRMANDPGTNSNPPFPNLPNPSTHPRGAYLQTPNPSDLVELFELVATKLKSLLVE